MVVLAELVDHVIGVDPDRDRVTAAVVSVGTQGELASKTFPATRRGYGQALRWAKTFTVDERRAWAIESTGSYGAGLAATLAEKGEFVIEFDHPATRVSKDGAKSDSLDAVRAARETLGWKTWATPRSRGL
jgi:transposase